MNQLSKSLYLNLYSFMDDCDLANFGKSHKVANTLKQVFYEYIETMRLQVWKEIFSSSLERIWLGKNAPEQVCLNEKTISFFCLGQFFLYNRAAQRNDKIDFEHCVKINSPDKWSITVQRLLPSNNLYSIVDKETGVFLYNVHFSELKQERNIGKRILAVFGSNQDGILEFMTDEGHMILHKNTPSKQERQVISCRPSRLSNHKASLVKVCKVKDCFYFQWQVAMHVNYTVISAMKDLTKPNDHLFFKSQDEDDSTDFDCDDNFFYFTANQKVYVCKDLKVWKEIQLNYGQGCEIYPSDYGLVTIHCETAASKKLITRILVWNHRKIEKEVPTPILEIQLHKTNSIYDQCFVKEDLIFILGKQIDVYHIPTKTRFVYDVPSYLDLRDIRIRPGRIPTEVVGVCQENTEKPNQDRFYLYQNKKR